VSRPVRALAAAACLLAATPALAAKKPLAPGDRFDLNRASAAELMRLPGVGEKKAQAIVALRSKKPFARPEDVLAVRGLGPAWFARVKGHLVVGGAPSVSPLAGVSAAAGAAPAHAAPAGARR
jgi:competence protein ComEA